MRIKRTLISIEEENQLPKGERKENQDRNKTHSYIIAVTNANNFFFEKDKLYL
jgi:hypothetical protein